MQRPGPGLLFLALAGAGGCGGACGDRASFRDADGDGWGDPAATTDGCGALADVVARAGDCDDADALVHPGAVEGCDGVDEDCDGRVDDDPEVGRFVDADGDGFGDGGRPAGCDAWGVEDATDCDDADPELHPATRWFVDEDGDGVGAGPAGEGCAPPEPGAVRISGDCDDADPDRFPGAPERCDGVDQDCVEGAEGGETWAFPDLQVRIPLTIEPVAGSSTPLVVDLDLRALGLAAPPDPGSFRLAAQDCGGALGEVELPVQWLDRVRGLLAAGAKADPEGDGVGTLVALWDTDADAATVEGWPAGPVRLALYLQGPASPYRFAGDVVAGDERLEAGGLVATFDPAAGGLLEALSLDGGPAQGSQTLATRGNGVLTPAGPLSAQDVPGVVELLDAGPLTAAVTASAELDNTSGTLRTATTYRVFAGRPALLLIPRAVAATGLSIHGDPDRAEPLRPFQLSLCWEGGACEVDPGLGWADQSTAELGLTWAWVAPPRWVVALGCAAPETWAAGNDLQGGAPGLGTDGTVPAGTPVWDEPVAVLLPHGPGGALAASAERVAWQTPAVPTWGEPQTWRR